MERDETGELRVGNDRTDECGQNYGCGTEIVALLDRHGHQVLSGLSIKRDLPLQARSATVREAGLEFWDIRDNVNEILR